MAWTPGPRRSGGPLLSADRVRRWRGELVRRNPTTTASIRREPGTSACDIHGPCRPELPTSAMLPPGRVERMRCHQRVTASGVRRPQSERLRRRQRCYFAIMGFCLLLIVLAWNLVRLWSTTAAVVMSVVAAVLPPIAVVVANWGEDR